MSFRLSQLGLTVPVDRCAPSPGHRDQLADASVVLGPSSGGTDRRRYYRRSPPRSRIFKELAHERRSHDRLVSQADDDTARAHARAVIYLRVSTKEQAGRGGETEGFSIPAQREACIRKAKALDAVVIEEFIDAGESAKTAQRPELQRDADVHRRQPRRNT